jgi:hypothetical protein
VSKATIARGGIGFYLTLRYLKEMQDNYRNGDWLEAGKDSAWFALAITPVVAPEFFFARVAYPVVMGVGAGTLAAIAIVEVTGIGEAEDVVDFVLDPPTPAEWYEVVAPAVEKKYKEMAKKSDEFQIAAVAWVDRRLMEGQHYLEREYQEKKQQVETGWELLNRYGRWANPVHLPF